MNNSVFAWHLVLTRSEIKVKNDKTTTTIKRKKKKKTRNEKTQLLNLTLNIQLGVEAHACNLATWRLGCLDGLRSRPLGAVVLCRSGVRAKFGVNIGSTEKSELSRLVKEE